MRFEGLKYDSPNTFTRAQRLQLALLPPLLTWVYTGLFRTNRFHCARPVGKLGGPNAPPQGIIAVWHETCGLMGAIYRNTNFHTLTSYSFDGELAARIVRCMGFEAVRGSSSRGGFDALNQLEAALEHVPYVGLTVDGPKGPRRKPKPGAAMLSARTGLPIIPIATVADPCWRLKSWDRFIIPKPFGRVSFAYGEPIPPPADCGRESIAAKCAEIEVAINALHAELGDES